MTKKIKIILIIVIVVVILLTVFFIFSREEKVEYVTAEVKRENLIQTVSEVGMVKAIKEVELNFLQSGRIAKILARIGDKVKQGQVLTELDYSSLSIKEQEAQANLDITQANLNKLLAGATAGEIAVSQAKAEQAKVAYRAALEELAKIRNTTAENITQAEKDLADLESSSSDNITPYEQAVTIAQTNLNNTKSTYQRAIDNKEDIALTTIDDKLAVANTALDAINTIITDSDAENILSIKDTSYLANTENFYIASLELLEAAKSSLSIAAADKTKNNIDTAIQSFSTSLNKIFKTLDYCFSALENSITSSAFTQTELNAYKTNVSSQSTLISTSISAVQTAQHNLDDAILTYETKVAEAEDSLAKAQVNLDDAIKTARDNLSSAKVSSAQQITTAQAKVDTTLEAWAVAKVQLKEVKSPARIQDVSLYRAQVKQAEAALNLVKKQIEDSIIKAPIDGTIIKIEYEIGEQISATKAVMAMLSENNFEIEVDISEADIAKINKDNSVEVTLDAFGDDIKFSGRVYFIEPAETVIQDVIYYKVKIEFTGKEEKLKGIKSGMTANTVITTAQKNNVLIIPSRAIIEKNGDNKYTRVLVREKIIEKPIKIGLRGDEGMVEVLSGVGEGEQVVTFIKNNK